MSFGFQTRDASGNPLLTITDRITRFIASYTFSISAGQTINTSVTGMSQDGTWFLVCQPTNVLTALTYSIQNGFFSVNSPSSTTVTALVFRS